MNPAALQALPATDWTQPWGPRDRQQRRVHRQGQPEEAPATTRTRSTTWSRCASDSGVHVVPISTDDPLSRAGAARPGRAAEGERCKNFFALGLIYWLYDRPDRARRREWIGKKFASRRPWSLEANARGAQTPVTRYARRRARAVPQRAVRRGRRRRSEPGDLSHDQRATTAFALGQRHGGAPGRWNAADLTGQPTRSLRRLGRAAPPLAAEATSTCKHDTRPRTRSRRSGRPPSVRRSEATWMSPDRNERSRHVCLKQRGDRPGDHDSSCRW